MPNAMRQSGPRPALRHLAPAGNAPASRGLPAAAQRVGKVSASLPRPLSWGDAVETRLLLPEVADRCR